MRTELSKREAQVLGLYAKGKTCKEIARTLCLSVKTISAHRARIRIKKNVFTNEEWMSLLYGVRDESKEAPRETSPSN